MHILLEKQSFNAASQYLYVPPVGVQIDEFKFDLDLTFLFKIKDIKVLFSLRAVLLITAVHVHAECRLSID